MSERPVEKILAKCLHSSEDEQAHQLKFLQEEFLEWELFCLLFCLLFYLSHYFTYYFNATEIISFGVNKKTFSARYVNITIKYCFFI